MICFTVFLQMKSAPHLTAHVQVSIVFWFLVFLYVLQILQNYWTTFESGQEWNLRCLLITSVQRST